MKQRWVFPEPEIDVCQIPDTREQLPGFLSLLLLKVGLKLMKAPGSVASENWSLTAGKIQQGHPPVQR